MSYLNISDINSVFQNVARSDTNASLVLGVLLEEEGLLPFDQQPEDVRKSLSELYLSSVFYDGLKMQELLLNYGVEKGKLSVTENQKIFENLTAHTNVLNVNDVSCAVLSASKDALLNLARLYEVDDKVMDVNNKEAIPQSNIHLKNTEATKHRPLDLAVMLYVSQKRVDLKRERGNKMAGESLSRVLEPLLKGLAGSGAEVSGVEVIPAEGRSNVSGANITEEKIYYLIKSGARGSRGVYFPATDESLDDPFNSDAGFEVMNIKNFCKENSALFPEAMVSLLLNDNVSAPSNEQRQP